MTKVVTMSHKPEPTRQDVWRMFNRIALRYDFLNHFLSFNRDVAWRRAVADLLPPGDDLRVLDLASGPDVRPGFNAYDFDFLSDSTPNEFEVATLPSNLSVSNARSHLSFPLRLKPKTRVILCDSSCYRELGSFGNFAKTGEAGPPAYE